ncbi:MAG: glycosyltransferase family 4 protein [Bacteroidota bacterium]
MQQKYLLVWDRIGDYHRSRWKALAEKAGSENVFGADLGAADSLYKWENTSALPGHFQLSKLPVEKRDFWSRVNAFRRILSNEKITAVGIAGYGRPEYLAFLLIAFLTGRKVVMFAESWYGGPSLLNKLKGLYLKMCVNGYLVSGIRAETHFINNLDIPAKRIQIGYSVVDNSHFASKFKGSTSHNAAASGNEKASQSPKPILLCIARFSPEKNLEALIVDFLKSKIADTYILKLVGGGPLQSRLAELAAGNKNVLLSPWETYSKLPQIYAGATWFILPSTFEPWGLVVNEAMAAGLPLILSTECGCAPDLLGPDNGIEFCLPAGKEQKEEKMPLLPDAINSIANYSAQQIEAMGNASKMRIASFSPQTWADSFIRLSKM